LITNPVRRNASAGSIPARSTGLSRSL